jgi:hypothetical protein
MGIKDVKRFAELDALIKAGYGDMPQDKIPDEAMIAAEDGVEIPIRGPSRDTRFAFPIEGLLEPRPRKPEKKRILTQAQIERRRERAKSKWFYKYGPRPKKEKQSECQDALSPA